MATIHRYRPLVLAPGSYARLGLRHGASATDIKRAYRMLVLRFHPDRAGDTSLPDFLAIQTAYESLQALAPLSTPPATFRRDDPAAAHPRSSGPETTPRTNATIWAGARWYWEGLLANAARPERKRA